MADKLTLHHLEYSQSFRVLWLLEELGLDYQLQRYNRDPVTVLAPPEYKAISPLGTAPVITHNGMALAESSAILDYIMDSVHDSPLRPAIDDPHRARYLFWLHAAQGSMMPVQLMMTVLAISRKRAPFFIRPIARGIESALMQGFIMPRLTALLDKAEADLAEAPYFGGDRLTIADILISYNMIGCDERGLINDKHPNCKAWIARIKSMPSFQSATAKDDRPSMILPL